MTAYTQTTKTFNQLAAEFATVFKDLRPVASPKPVTQADRLEPYRPHILKQRKRGLTSKQIADGMGAPRIGAKVSERVLRIYFANDATASGATAQTTATAPATEEVASATTPATAVATAATGKTTVVTTAPATAAMACTTVRTTATTTAKAALAMAKTTVVGAQATDKRR